MSTSLLRAVARAAVVASFGLLLAGCSDRTAPTTAAPLARVSKDLTAPSGLVTVTQNDNSVTFWPYTGDDFSGTPVDPINLVFFGNADPRALRAALLSLDGDRSAEPLLAPFDCTWHDVPEGSVQTAYGSTIGWTASVIQLACGEYGPIRFHLRLFGLGGATIGGAHFEVQVPATPEHQVLSWELAKMLVAFDFGRSGLLDVPPVASGVINAAPTYRDIPPEIFNGLLGDANAAVLLGLLGYPSTVQDAPVPIPSSGSAAIVTLARLEEGQPLVAQRTFVIEFDQVIPKPICVVAPYVALQIKGPLTFTQHVVLTRSGNYLSNFQLRGHLDATPIDPTGEEPPGEPIHIQVNEVHHAILTDNVTLAASFIMQITIPSSGPEGGSLVTRLSVGPGNASFSDATIRCGQ